MEKKIVSLNSSSAGEEELLSDNEIKELMQTLPRETNWDGSSLFQYQGFWWRSTFIPGVIKFQRQFKPKESDIILITFPKSGTTWLKSLVFSIINRSHYTPENSPLLTTFSHDLVPFLDIDIFQKNRPAVLEDLPEPRILATHAPYVSLPQSVVNSNCRIVYMCRNPLDQFVSLWQFLVGRRHEMIEQPLSLDEALDKACNGVQGFGPIWEHILGYWKASKEEPHKILFLKYEDVKEDTNFYIKRLADFLGCAFSEDEVSRGVIEEISTLCSFNNMKDLQVNKSDQQHLSFSKYLFFRKGEVGDWKNYLTPAMFERLQNLIKEKIGDSGLTFKTL